MVMVCYQEITFEHATRFEGDLCSALKKCTNLPHVLGIVADMQVNRFPQVDIPRKLLDTQSGSVGGVLYQWGFC